jgi:hypothetical protein
VRRKSTAKVYSVSELAEANVCALCAHHVTALSDLILTPQHAHTRPHPKGGNRRARDMRPLRYGASSKVRSPGSLDHVGPEYSRGFPRVDHWHRQRALLQRSPALTSSVALGCNCLSGCLLTKHRTCRQTHRVGASAMQTERAHALWGGGICKLSNARAAALLTRGHRRDHRLGVRRVKRIVVVPLTARKASGPPMNHKYGRQGSRMA